MVTITKPHSTLTPFEEGDSHSRKETIIDTYGNFWHCGAILKLVNRCLGTRTIASAHQRLILLPFSRYGNKARKQLSRQCMELECILIRIGLRNVYCAVLQVNVGGLENVLKAAKRTPTVKKIIYTSSFFAIGPTDGYVADETQVRPYS